MKFISIVKIYLEYALIILYATLASSFFCLFGWRWADGNWIFKWYIKTEHGRNLERKVGKKIFPWTY